MTEKLSNRLLLCTYDLFFFFFKQKTAYEMRISDWSSDVCSSDLIDRDSQNMTADTIAAFITPRTRAIICVHLAGWPCDMDPIMTLADSNGLWVVEDCAPANGARYKNRPVGSTGHIGTCTFWQDKSKTTGGEGCRGTQTR